jgi:hypothetical protein
MMLSSLLIRGFHGSCVHIGAEALAQPLDRRIRLECSRGANDPILLLKQTLARGRSEVRLNRFEGDANIPPQVLRQTLQKLVIDGPCAPIRRRLIELQSQQTVLE